MGNQLKSAQTGGAAETVKASAEASALEWDLVALTPTFIDSEHAAYANAIVRALEDPLVRNIALSGNYGVGKSSILQQVSKLKKNEVVELSLSTLAPVEESEVDDSVPRQATTPTNRIQQEIVKQLLYREEPHKTAGSRFRRIERFRPLREVAFAVLAGFAATLVFMIAGWGVTIAITLKPVWDAGLWIYPVIWLVGAGVAYAARSLLHGRVHIKQISAGAAAVTLDEKSVSYFDQYLDEIVYFFETSKYRVVIFEDIDRFNNSHIFETLRSLNTLLNAAPQIDDRPVRFIYAIKDSIFDRLGLAEEGRKTDRAGAGLSDPAQAEIVRANRTKFFDLVIPVVPFITHRSARNLTTQILSGITHEVSDELIDLAGRFVPDMRLLKNVRNEFVVFRDRIFSSDGRQLNLSETDLFAMMLYKSTHLSDFEVIRLGKSDLDSLYEFSRGLVVANVARLESRIRAERQQIANARSVAARSKRLGDRLIERIEFLIRAASFQPHNWQYIYADSAWPANHFRSVAFWTEFVEGDGTKPVIWRNTSYGQQITLTRADIEVLLGETLDASTWKDIDRNAATENIAGYQEQLGFLRSADMGDLIKRPEFLIELEGEKHSFHEVAERLLTRGLAFELVKAGYIDRNFTLYTSTFHGDRVGPAATNFIIHHVERGRMDEHFELDPDDVDAVVRERGEQSLGDSALFNIAILDYLLAEKKSGADVMVGALARLEADARRFLQSYLSSGDHTEDLIAELTARSSRLLRYLAVDIELDDEARAHFVSVCLSHLSDQVDQRVDDDVATYLRSSYATLSALTTDALSATAARRVAKLFAEADIPLPDLAPLTSTVRAEFVNLDLYVMTVGNLEAALGDGAGLALDEIRAVSREQVYAKALKELPDYLDAVESVAPTNKAAASFPIVINEVHDAASSLLERVIVAASKDSVIDDLGGVPEEAWTMLARDNRFRATYVNVTRYLEHAGGVDEALAVVLVNAEKISEFDNVEQEARRDLAVTLIAASSMLTPPLRAKLAKSLQLKYYIAVDTLPAEAGPLFGELRTRNVIQDNAATYAHVAGMDWATKEAVLRESEKLAEWVTPELVGVDLGPLLASTAVSDAAKRVIIEQADAYAPLGGRPGLHQLARLAVDFRIDVTLAVVEQMAAHGVPSGRAVTLLRPHLAGASADQITGVLRSLGGEYARLAYVGRDKPKVPNTPATIALLKALRAKGVVASFDESADPIKVNKRYK